MSLFSRQAPVKFMIPQSKFHYYRDALFQGVPIQIEVPKWVGRGYVTELVPANTSPIYTDYQVTFVPIGPDFRRTSSVGLDENLIRETLTNVERLLRSHGTSVSIDRETREVPLRYGDAYQHYELGRDLTITIKGQPQPNVPLRIPKLWDVPISLKDLETVHPNCRCVPVYHDVMYKHKDFGVTLGGSGFLASSLEQAKGRMVRSMQAKIDAMMMGTLQTKHKEKKMFDKKTLKANRFYVGSPRALRDGWGKPTLAEAVEHAKAQLESTGEDQFVVQIVRVVKKKEQPVVVEAIK